MLKRSGFAQKARKPMKRAWIATRPKRGRRALIAQADALTQAIVVERDIVCQFCGRPATDGHHIIRRGYYPLRWRAEYIIGLCHDCHELDKHPVKKKELLAYCIYWLGGQEKYDQLRLEGNTGTSEEPGDAITRLQKELDK